MNGIVTRNVSTSDTDCAISTPSTPNIIGRISTIGAKNRPCRHRARNEAMPVRPMVWVIILPIMLKPLRITVQHWICSAATPTATTAGSERKISTSCGANTHSNTANTTSTQVASRTQNQYLL